MDRSGQKRKLATILAADVVGYSKMMAADEEGTIRTLKSHREIFDKFINRHEGRIFNTGGDSVLAEFGSTVEAVRCAMAVQEELNLRNAALVPDRQMRFRIGINVGDVLVDGTDLLGDGVNVAARLEGLAQPGGICISGSAFEQVKNKLSIGFADLGPQQVKNIPEPIAAYGVTSSPVSVQRSATPRGPAGGLRKARLPIAAGVAGAILLAAAGYGVFRYSAPRATDLSSFPAKLSTTGMGADDIAAFMTGMTIQGVRSVDGNPFRVVLHPDRTATYAFGPEGAAPENLARFSGTWRTDNSLFCMQLPRFARNQEICPRIVRDGGKITAMRPNGDPLPWTLSK